MATLLSYYYQRLHRQYYISVIRKSFLSLMLVAVSLVLGATAVSAQSHQIKAVLRSGSDSRIAIEDIGPDGTITFIADNNVGIVINSAGNVGIGKSPTTRLDVNGTIKATKVENAGSGGYIYIFLYQCGGGPCSGNHPVNTWTELSNLGYSWITGTNTLPSVFSHNGSGRITVGQSGTYHVRLSAMLIPTATTGVPAIICPFLNGGANCNNHGYYSSGLQHRYYPAGWWGRSKHEFVMNLPQGTIVGYGIHPTTTLTRWGHDNYTSLELRRIN